MRFKFFNPNEPVEITRQNLPHWDQAGAMYFITFRMADSIPKEVFDRWTAERSAWLWQHGIDTRSEDWHWRLECLPNDLRREFHRSFTARWHDNLDACHGSCVLRDPQLAQIVANALLHFNNARCEIDSFVVMPNHAHVLIEIQGRSNMKKLCSSWKRFSAREINLRLGKSGAFWQPESFDHIVRNLASYEKFRRYITDNPGKAGLRPGEYLFWQCSPATP